MDIVLFGDEFQINQITRVPTYPILGQSYFACTIYLHVVVYKTQQEELYSKYLV